MVREEVLRAFFAGTATGEDLALDLVGALVPDGPLATHHPIVDMTDAFEVQPAHLVRVCDAVLDGAIAPDLLAAIGFCLVASDAFVWDGDTPDGSLVAEIAFDWSESRVNWPLTLHNVVGWRKRLLGQEANLEGN